MKERERERESDRNKQNKKRGQKMLRECDRRRVNEKYLKWGIGNRYF